MHVCMVCTCKTDESLGWPVAGHSAHRNGRIKYYGHLIILFRMPDDVFVNLPVLSVGANEPNKAAQREWGSLVVLHGSSWSVVWQNRVVQNCGNSTIWIPSVLKACKKYKNLTKICEVMLNKYRFTKSTRFPNQSHTLYQLSSALSALICT